MTLPDLPSILDSFFGPAQVREVGGSFFDQATGLEFDADVSMVNGVVRVEPTFVNRTLASPTISAPTFTGDVLYQGTNHRILLARSELATSDATVSTLGSYSMNDETLCSFEVIVTAARKVNVTKGGRYKRSVCYRRTSAGNATIVGTLETVGTDKETDAGLDVTIDTDGAHLVRVRVTGIAATNFNWTCELRVQETLAT